MCALTPRSRFCNTWVSGLRQAAKVTCQTGGAESGARSWAASASK